jgi:Transcription factor WhiB
MNIGNCAGDENPDWWFPELPSGAFSDKTLQVIADQTNYALQLCATCPVKEECLAEGMKSEQIRNGVMMWGNLAHGIWGGKMAAERIMMAGIKRESYSYDSRALPVRMFNLYKVLRPLLRR